MHHAIPISLGVLTESMGCEFWTAVAIYAIALVVQKSQVDIHFFFSPCIELKFKDLIFSDVPSKRMLP